MGRRGHWREAIPLAWIPRLRIDCSMWKGVLIVQRLPRLAILIRPICVVYILLWELLNQLADIPSLAGLWTVKLKVHFAPSEKPSALGATIC